MENLKGLYAAQLTPFKNNVINYGMLEKHIENNIKNGLQGLYVCGSSGEAMLMSEEERIEILSFTAKIVNGRVNLLAHIGSINTDSAVRMANVAKDNGYDAISAVAPYYYGFSAEVIKKYYADIMAECNMPLIMYNFPSSSGFNGMLQVVADLIDNTNLIGVKHTSANLFELERFKHLKRELLVFNGYDEMLLGGLAMGADGGIGSTYNFMSKLILAIYDNYNVGNIEKAQKIQTKVNEIISAIIPHGVFPMAKEILTQSGLEMGECRRPFEKLSKKGKLLACEIAESLK